MKKRTRPTGPFTKGATDDRAAKARAIKERARKFEAARPLTEPELAEMVKAHMETHGVVICPPAYLAPTQALQLLRAPEPPERRDPLGRPSRKRRPTA